MEHTPVLSLVWQIAAYEAADNLHNIIDVEHFFIALCKLEGFANVNRLRALGVPDSQVSAVEAEIDLLMGLFQRFGIKTTVFRRELRFHKGKGSHHIADSHQEWVMHRSPGSRTAFEWAEGVAEKQQAPMLTVMHLLAGLLAEPQTDLTLWLNNKKIEAGRLKQAAIDTAVVPVQGGAVKTAALPAVQTAAAGLSAQYTRNLIQLAQRGRIRLEPYFQDALARTIQALDRPAKNNPLLLVEQGHAAKIVANNLAWQIANNAGPAGLSDWQVLEVQLNDMAANISFQGEFAQRMQNMVEEVGEQGRVILFIDGIETIIGSGAIHVEMDGVINALLTAISQGKIRCLAATKPMEYYRYIGPKDHFKAIFQPVSVSAQADATLDELTVPLINTSGPDTRQPALEASPESAPAALSPSTAGPQMVSNILFQDLEDRLSRFGLTLYIKPGAMKLVRRLGSQVKTGTLRVREIIATEIENPLGGMLLRGEVDYGHTVIVDAVDDTIRIKVEKL